MSQFAQKALLGLISIMRAILDWEGPAPAVEAKLSELRDTLKNQDDALESAVSANQPH